MKTKRILSILILMASMSFTAVYANNIKVTSVPKTASVNETEGSAMICFGLSWDNSWRTNRPNNWDAAWVFAKIRRSGSDWQHAYIDTLDSKHKPSTAKDGTPIIIKTGRSTLDNGRVVGMGVFIYRAQNGGGTIEIDTVQLKWNYRADGVDDGEIVSIRVFAVEMVYVPDGKFQLGDYMGSNFPLSLSKWDNTIISVADVMETSIGAERYQIGGQQNSVLPRVQTTNAGSQTIPFTTATGLDVTAVVSQSADYGSGYRIGYAFEARIRGWNYPSNPQGALNGTLSDTYRYLPNGSGAYGRINLSKGFRANQFAITYGPYGVTEAYNGQWANFEIEGSLNGGVTWIPLAASDRATTTPNCGFSYEIIKIPTSKQDFYKDYRIIARTDGSYVNVCFIGLNNTNGECGNWEGDTCNPNTPPAEMSYKTGRYTRVPLGNFPTGEKAFYMMKHELTASAYVDFLNTLSVVQQKARVPATLDPSSNPTTDFFTPSARCYVRLKEKAGTDNGTFGLWVGTGGGHEAWDADNNGGNLPMVGLKWMDAAAYLDWAGLRPLTELEFEKACRGPLLAKPHEYAWGASANDGYYTGYSSTAARLWGRTIKDPYTPTETSVEEAPAYDYASATQWPIRVGAFAKPGNTRAESGAGYYGALNLSDNACERYISVDVPVGRAFEGNHGDGMLKANGDPDASTWPLTEDAKGTGFRGAFLGYAYDYVNTTSDRTASRMTETGGTTRVWYQGCRGGRTAPK